MNDISTTIFYNQRIVLSAPIPEPVVWHVSKVEQTAPKGVNRITFAQEEWDEHKDVFEFEYFDNSTMSYKTRVSNTLEYNEQTEKIVGMWASYWADNIAPEDSFTIDEKKSTLHSSISCSGGNPELKIGGGYKKLTVEFYDQEEKVSPQSGEWSFYIDDIDASEVLSIMTNDDSTDINENQIKIKFIGDKNYIGKILRVYHKCETAQTNSYIDIELKRL